MDMDLAQLRVFHSLSRTGSFTETARRLYRTQSAISHAIRKLEERIGFPLVERLPRGLRLTDQGRRLAEACNQAFAVLDAATEDLAQGMGPEKLRLGATVEFGSGLLLRLLAPFLRMHSSVRLEMHLDPDLLQSLLLDELDLILDCREHQHPGLQRMPLFREIYVVAAIPGIAHGLETPTHLSSTTLLSLDSEGKWWHRFLLALPEETRPKLGNLHVMNHIRAMIQAAREGLGILLAPRYSILRELEACDLVELFPDLNMQEDWFCLYQKQSRADRRLHRELVEYLCSITPMEFGA